MSAYFQDDQKKSENEENFTVPEDTSVEEIEIPETEESESLRLEKEISTLKEQMLRALADAENARKRSIKEKEDLAKYAVSDFSRSLLGVADNLRRALESADTLVPETNENSQIQSIITGIEMTEKELDTVFEKYGICKISPLHEKFDPHFHQAVAEIESDHPQGTITEVFQVGYLIHDRVLRPAMVSVAKKK